MPDEIVLDIDCGTELSEPWFRERFPAYQNQLRDASWTAVHLDFAQIEWADPLPLLALLCELKLAATSETLKLVTFKLGEWGSDAESVKRARARRYLVNHGWLLAFHEGLLGKTHFEYVAKDGTTSSVGDNKDKTREYRALADQILLDSSEVRLLYSQTALIDPMVVESDDWEAQISAAVESVNDAFFRRSIKRLDYRGTTLQRLRSCLKELVRNGIEHAYREGARDCAPMTPIIGVYARFLEPITDAKLKAAGLTHVARKDSLQPQASDDGWIEFVVLDVGRGLWTDAPEWARDNSLPSGVRKEVERLCATENREPGLSDLLWRNNLSRHGRATGSAALSERGHLTGLRYLNGVLGVHGDFTHWCSGGVWRWGRHPMDGSHAGRLFPLKTPFLGSAFRIGIDLKVATELPSHWFSPVTHRVATAHVVTRIAEKAQTDPTTFGDFSFFDLRSNVIGGNAQVNAMRATFTQSEAGSRVVRAPRHVDKADVSRMINEWLQAFARTDSLKASYILVFADLSRAQALNIELSLPSSSRAGDSGYAVKDTSFPVDVRILLMCEDGAMMLYKVKPGASFSVSTQEGGKESFVRLRFSTYDFNRLSADPRRLVQSEFFDVLASAFVLLRHHDSKLFWNRVDLLDQSSNKCLWKNVRWGAGDGAVVLTNYLDFAAAMRDREASRIVRRALRRSLALFPNSEYVCMDALVSSELHNAVRYFPRRKVASVDNSAQEPREKVAPTLVGSVRVTGATLRSYADISTAPPNVVDCFVVPEAVGIEFGIGATLTVLDWLRPDSAASAPAEYEQQPGTPFIRRIRLQEASVIDYDLLVKGTEFRAPADMYGDFVRDGLIKTGHWQYGNRHSLIEVDLDLALDGFRAVTNPGADDAFFGWLNRKLGAAFDGLNSPKVVLYPHHRLVRDIVAAFGDVYPQSDFAFIGVHLISSVAGGVAQIAESSSAQVLSALRGGDAVVILDMGYISKRTLRYLRRQLALNGIRTLLAVGLMNRSSSPAFPAEQRTSRLSTYWRWNVPILGREDQCGLCSALRAYAHFADRVVLHHAELEGTVKYVKRQWSVASLERQWRDVGLDPRPLGEPKRVKFGYSEGSSWREVEHRFSTTLVSHYIELARYTTDSLCLYRALERTNGQTEVRSRGASDPETTTPKDASVIFDAGTKVEMISSFLHVCGQSLEFGVALKYFEHLVDAIIDLSDWQDARRPEEVADFEAANRLFGIACLAIMNIDRRLHAGLGAHAKRALRSRRAFTPGPEWRPVDGARLFLIAALNHEDNIERLPPLYALDVCREQDLLMQLELLLGRGPAHEGSILSELQIAALSADHPRAIAAISSLAELLGRADGDLFKNMGIENAAKSSRVLAEAGRRLRSAAADLSQNIDALKGLIGDMRLQLLNHLIRCAPQTPDLKPALTIAATMRNQLLSDKINHARIRVVDSTATWGSSRQLIWCVRTRETVVSWFQNACTHGVLPILNPFETDSTSSNSKEHVWLRYTERAEGLEIALANGCSEDSLNEASKVKTPVYLKRLGGDVTAHGGKLEDDQSIFQVTILLPWLENLVAQSNDGGESYENS